MSEEMLYIPEFRDELLGSGLNLFVAKEEYLKKKWLIPGIVEGRLNLWTIINETMRDVSQEDSNPIPSRKTICKLQTVDFKLVKYESVGQLEVILLHIQENYLFKE
jgi:hypothetical protein